MYDDLVKRLRECTAEQNGEKTLWNQAADAIESTSKAYQMISEAYEAEVTKQVWIPVAERLPDKPGIYAVWTAKGFGNHLSTSCFDGDSWSLRITHWMPLPEPPKEET